MRTFAQVIDSGSFANASRTLDVAPAVVTRLVPELERHLGADQRSRTVASRPIQASLTISHASKGESVTGPAASAAWTARR